MYRFFVQNKISNSFELSKDTLNHIKAIRLEKNEKFYCIYNEEIYICHLENNQAIIEEKTNINNEYEGDVVLFASIIKIKRFEWLIQKATELGVKKIYPIISDNVNKKYVEQFKNKIIRFKEISKNSSEQSFRNLLVQINEPITFDEAINFNIKNKYMAHEKSNSNNKNDLNFLFETDVAFYVGPEGGFTEQEIEKAIQKNVKIISLGKKILRAETASIFLLSRIKN